MKDRQHNGQNKTEKRRSLIHTQQPKHWVTRNPLNPKFVHSTYLVSIILPTTGAMTLYFYVSDEDGICVPNLCLNGGTCTDLVSSPICKCRPGWLPRYCQGNYLHAWFMDYGDYRDFIQYFISYRAGRFYWWKKPKYPEKNHWPVATNWQTLSHDIVWSTSPPPYGRG
jgi:hypothetical protein